MSRADRRRALMLGLCSAAMLLAASGLRAEPRYQERWKMSSAAAWPPLIVEGNAVFRQGETLSAYRLRDGKLLWSKAFEGLPIGSSVLAAGAHEIYSLGGKGLHVLNPVDGSVLATRPVLEPSSVLAQGDAVYVVGRAGLFRFDARGQTLLGQLPGARGELAAADGRYALLYLAQATGGRGSPQRLVVLDLQAGKQVYKFNLLPDGGHHVVQFGQGRIAFLDFSRRDSAGQNARKLYLTEADYVHNKKLKDVELSRQHPATYGAAASDTFWVTSNAAGTIFLGNPGGAGEAASLIAYDPRRDVLLWNRSGAVLSLGLLHHERLLWSALTSGDGQAQAVAYSAEDGNLTLRLPLDGSALGAPVRAGDAVLVRTASSVFCFAPLEQPVAEKGPGAGPAVAALPPAPAPSVPAGGVTPLPVRAQPGWELYRDRTAGYLIELPRGWVFERSKFLRLGPARMSIPFVRTTLVQGRPTYLGSVHVLTWEAAGRDPEGLWRSVLTQRRQSNPDVRVLKLERVPNVGGSGLPGIAAAYLFRDPRGHSVELRSLCVVSHGIAFELRGWAGSQSAQELLLQIEDIFRHFRPHRFP